MATSGPPAVDAAPTRVVELVDAGGAVAGPPAPPIDAAVKVARRPPDELQLRLEEDARRMADMLTSDGPAISGDMSRRRPGADLGAGIAEVRGGGADLRIGGGAGRGGVGAPAKVGSSSGVKPTVKSSGRFSIVDKQALDDTTLTADAVIRKIMTAYMPGLKRCQQQLLAVSPQARGKLRIELTVTSSGRTTGSKANSFDASLDSCVTSLMTRWIFSIPKDADGEATDAAFVISFAVLPD